MKAESKMVTAIRKSPALSKGKRAHPECRLFRVVCWLPEPQPVCQDCKHLKEAVK